MATGRPRASPSGNAPPTVAAADAAVPPFATGASAHNRALLTDRPRDPAEWTEAEVLPAPASQHCIVTSAAGVFQESMLKSTSGANSDYAARHGYTYIELKDSAVHNLHGKNAKFQIILDSFVTHECLWVLWMDPEAEVITPTVKLEDIVAQFRGPAFIFVSAEQPTTTARCCFGVRLPRLPSSLCF